jgi:hypothetical protein
MSIYKTHHFKKNGSLISKSIDMSQTVFNALFSHCITATLNYVVSGAEQQNIRVVTLIDFLNIFEKRIGIILKAQYKLEMKFPIAVAFFTNPNTFKIIFDNSVTFRHCTIPRELIIFKTEKRKRQLPIINNQNINNFQVLYNNKVLNNYIQSLSNNKVLNNYFIIGNNLNQNYNNNVNNLNQNNQNYNVNNLNQNNQNYNVNNLNQNIGGNNLIQYNY